MKGRARAQRETEGRMPAKTPLRDLALGALISHWLPPGRCLSVLLDDHFGWKLHEKSWTACRRSETLLREFDENVRALRAAVAWIGDEGLRGPLDSDAPRMGGLHR